MRWAEQVRYAVSHTGQVAVVNESLCQPANQIDPPPVNFVQQQATANGTELFMVEIGGHSPLAAGLKIQLRLEALCSHG